MTSLVLLLALGSAESLDAVLHRASADHDVKRACALVDGWIASASEPDEQGRALLWEAQALAAVDEFPLAEQALARLAKVPVGPELRLDAALLQADVRLLEGAPDEAARLYRAIDAPRDSRWAYVASMQARRAVEEAARIRLAWLLTALLAAGCLACFAAGVRGGATPPEEFLWVAPVLALLALAALTLSPAERAAVLCLALGGAVLVYAAALALRSRPPRGPWRAVAVLAGVAASAGLLYSSLVLSGLWLRVADTLAGGVE